MNTIVYKFILILFVGFFSAIAQNASINGQASGWITVNPNEPKSANFGIRYLPEFTASTSFSENTSFDADVSLNGFVTEYFSSATHPKNEYNAKLYRASLRFSAEHYELRAGLQKISFGSASIFRPLMWFDRIDPRDPLQITNGVYGILGRYYFSNNTNLWLWSLYGNNATKGWEIAATKKNSIEFGGRIQTPLASGELGISVHRRTADLNTVEVLKNLPNKKIIPENKFGIDGKWDIGIGMWCEASVTHWETDIAGMKFTRHYTLGADNTFEIGNGLTTIVEFFRTDNSDALFQSSNGINFSAFSVQYPINIFDRVSIIVYKNWKNNKWYRIATFQRTYDNWIVYLLGFWNPETIRLMENKNNSMFSGTGVQLMIVFNH